MTPQNTQTVFVACPTHNGLVDSRTARSLFQTISKKHNILTMIMQNSLLAHGCNQMYCHALNQRTEHENLKWFAMLHADIVPDQFWLDTLIDIAERESADMLSVIVPIKDGRGVTSTALGQQGTGFGSFARLTMKQVHALPETFDRDTLKDWLENKVLEPLRIPNIGDHHDLLLNTGCMIVRLDKPWSDELYFNITDRIQHKFGKYYAEVEPEDWFFSRRVAELGGKVMATSAVKVQHIGNTGFNSAGVWGENIDPEALKVLNVER